MKEKITRKEFLKRTAAIGLSTGISSLPLNLMADSEVPRSLAKPSAAKVALAINEAVQGDNHEIKQEIVELMLQDSMKKLMDTGSAIDAWRQLFKPTDIVGIKINCLFGPGICTSHEVTNVVIKGLVSAGVPEEQIIVWDRSEGDLRKSGYLINRDGSGVKYYATNSSKVGYEEQPTKVGNFNGRLSRILTEHITALVNVPILKDHSLAGITVTMKNHYGSFDNPGDHHANNCDPYIAELNSIPVIKDKTRLLVVDTIRPLANGGPGNKPQFRWDYNGLLVGMDPVAVDYHGWEIIEAKRKEFGVPTLQEAGRPPKQLASANRLGLGENDPQKIQLIQV